MTAVGRGEGPYGGAPAARIALGLTAALGLVLAPVGTGLSGAELIAALGVIALAATLRRVRPSAPERARR